MHSMPTRLIIVPHGEAHPRSTWSGHDDDRPLAALGRQQAAALAEAIGPVDAIRSSPSLRCVQTVEPLAALSALPIVTLEAWRQAAREPSRWDRHLDETMRLAVHGASVAGRVGAAIGHADGCVAVCSHGDTIPIVIGHLAARLGADVPALVGRGGWYEVAGGVITAHGDLVGEH
jgi:8-oxo-dGTP diphosphatase